MKNTLFPIIITSLVAVLTVGGCGFQPEENVEPPDYPTVTIDHTKYYDVTLEEAGWIVDVTIPTPSYLPRHYELQKVYVRVKTSRSSYQSVWLCYCDRGFELKEGWPDCQILFEMSWSPEGHFPGFKAPGERVTVEGSIQGFGVLNDTEEDYNHLVWQWRPDPDKDGEFQITLYTAKHISIEDRVAVAESLMQ